MKHAMKQEKSHQEEPSGCPQMFDLNIDFKAAITNMFKELKITIFKK